mmetsp:Transcript_12049/g.24418  ORF Transcript_12049/g.24418 Transcript_12049/m.24418 type:complete len:209 (-) Transcript_12049:1670-2296(-)
MGWATIELWWPLLSVLYSPPPPPPPKDNARGATISFPMLPPCFSFSAFLAAASSAFRRAVAPPLFSAPSFSRSKATAAASCSAASASHSACCCFACFSSRCFAVGSCSPLARPLNWWSKGRPQRSCTCDKATVWYPPISTHRNFTPPAFGFKRNSSSCSSSPSSSSSSAREDVNDVSLPPPAWAVVSVSRIVRRGRSSSWVGCTPSSP